jgi:hypothetical protein
VLILGKVIDRHAGASCKRPAAGRSDQPSVLTIVDEGEALLRDGRPRSAINQRLKLHLSLPVVERVRARLQMPGMTGDLADAGAKGAQQRHQRIDVDLGPCGTLRDV